MLRLSCDVSCLRYRSTIKLISNYFDDWKSIRFFFFFLKTETSEFSSAVWMWIVSLLLCDSELNIFDMWGRNTFQQNCPFLKTWPEAWGATVQMVQRGKAAVLWRQSFSTHSNIHICVQSHVTDSRCDNRRVHQLILLLVILDISNMFLDQTIGESKKQSTDWLTVKIIFGCSSTDNCYLF